MVIELILSTASFVSDLISKVSGSKKETKAAISADLEKIAETLEKVANSLQAGQYPHGACQMMHDLADQFIDKIGPYLDSETSQKLAADLHESANVERLFAEKTDVTVDKIKIAAGRFLAAALLVKY